MSKAERLKYILAYKDIPEAQGILNGISDEKHGAHIKFHYHDYDYDTNRPDYKHTLIETRM